MVFSSYGITAVFFWFMYSLPLFDNTATRTVLHFMGLETGGAHPGPLAGELDIQLDMEPSANLLDVRAEVIGDQIVLVLDSWSTCTSTTRRATPCTSWIGN
jgi:hypothetical protein